MPRFTFELPGGLVGTEYGVYLYPGSLYFPGSGESVPGCLSDSLSWDEYRGSSG